MFNYLFNKTKENKTVRKVEGEDKMNKKDWFKKVVILMAAIGFAVGYPDGYASEYSNIEYVDASTNLGVVYFPDFQGYSRADYLNRVGPGNAQTANTPDGKYQVSMYFTGNSTSEVAIIFKGVSGDAKGDNRDYVYTLLDASNKISIRGFGPQYNDYYVISVVFSEAYARGDFDVPEPTPEPAPTPAPAPKPEPAPAPAPTPPASNNGGNSSSNQSSGSSGSSSTGSSDSSSSVSDNTSYYDNSQSEDGSGEDSYEETETISNTYETEEENEEEAEEETEEKAEKENKEKEIEESVKEPRTTAYPLKDFEFINWENKSDDDHVSVKSSHNKADDGSNISTAFYLAAGVITIGLAFVITQKKTNNKV